MIDKLKEYGDALISRSKTNLMIDGYVAPVLITVKNGGTEVETFDLPMDDSHEDMTNQLIIEKSKEADVDAMILLIEARTMDVNETEKIPETLAGDDRASEAIYLAIYKRDETVTRHVLFSKDEKGVPAFIDLGWVDVNDNTNPWRK